MFPGFAVASRMAQDGNLDWEETSRSSVVATAVSAVTIAVAFALLAAGWSGFWVVFVIGFAAVLPLAVKLTEWYESRPTERERGEQDALDALREQYATGEIDDAEFERRLERLLETESASDAERFHLEAESRATTREYGRRRN